MDFNLFMQALNGITGIGALAASYYIYKYHHSNLDPWPKNLRIFVLYFCFYGSVSLALTSTILATLALTIDIPRPLIYHLFRLLLAVVCLQLRVSYFFTTMERMLATIFLEKYARFSTPFMFFGIYFVFSLFIQIICNLTSFLIVFEVIPSDFLAGGYENIIWMAFLMHLLTLISCKFLHDKNQKMYKLLAYQITLQQRHQIVENIKVLSTLWPTILVFSVISPIGPAATWINTLTTNNVGSIGLFHITYNLTPIIMAFYCKYHSQKQRAEVFPTDSVAKEQQLVKSPFGASLPTHISQEIYFNDLRIQWN